MPPAIVTPRVEHGAGHQTSTLDARRETRRERARFAQARRAERQYSAQLRHIARQIGAIIRGLFDPENPDDPGWDRINATLDNYTRLIEPWAEAVARRMLADVSRRDETAWYRLSRQLGESLRGEIAQTPTGQILRDLMAAQVHLITSLPREAAQRVHHLSIEQLSGGRRWEEIAKDVLGSGEVSKSRANLIARTETGRAQSTFTAARAQHVGSPGFIWRTARDRDVRRLHAGYEGRFFTWTDPPLLDDGRPGLPGGIWNCRCYCEVVLPDQDIARRLGPQPRSRLYEAALLPEADDLNERYRRGDISRAEYETGLEELARGL